jgi:hypothetical protein
VFAALAVSRWLERQTGWSIKKARPALRRYRSIALYGSDRSGRPVETYGLEVSASASGLAPRMAPKTQRAFRICKPGPRRFARSLSFDRRCADVLVRVDWRFRDGWRVVRP